jgi:hypothetical protein
MQSGRSCGDRSCKKVDCVCGGVLKGMQGGKYSGKEYTGWGVCRKGGESGMKYAYGGFYRGGG